MVLESTQLLAGSIQSISDLTYEGIYRKTHINHPCAKWVRESYRNLRWMLEYSFELSDQYSLRFGKVHACLPHLKKLDQLSHLLNHKFESSIQTPFVQCMPDIFKQEDPVLAYRAYYHSKTFAQWNRGVLQPHWWQGVTA